MTDPHHENYLTRWLIALLLVAVAVTISFQWLDRPISFFAHEHLRQPIFERLTRISEYLAPIAVLVFAAIGLRALIGGTLSKIEAAVLLCAISVVTSAEIKDQLKFMFGRTWPETWVNDNPSLIRDGAYGFNFFHGGRGYNSFPSGHTTVVCAAMVVLWFLYPRWRPLWALIALAVAVGLVGANYHFLADVIAGAFIGISTGWIAVLLWRRTTEDGRRTTDKEV
jgi:membrane-associated phospholipid phosphatase